MLGKSRKKTKNKVLSDEINIMKIIYDNTFNLHNSFLDNDKRYMKVTLKFKLIGVARLLISADYCELLNLHMEHKMQHWVEQEYYSKSIASFWLLELQQTQGAQ